MISPGNKLPSYFSVLAGSVKQRQKLFHVSISVWKIDPNEELDSNGRMPRAFASFMRSLGYLAWMFIAFVYIAAVPSEYVWQYSFAFMAAVPIANIFALKWKDFATNNNRVVLNAE